MQPEILIKFTDFQLMIEAAIRERKDYTTEVYKDDVGNAVRAFSEAYKRRYNKRKFDWRIWLSTFEMGEGTEFFEEAPESVIDNLRAEGGASRWANMFHYRLHAEASDLFDYAKSIDEAVFGEALSASGQLVFQFSSLSSGKGVEEFNVPVPDPKEPGSGADKGLEQVSITLTVSGETALR